MFMDVHLKDLSSIATGINSLLVLLIFLGLFSILFFFLFPFVPISFFSLWFFLPHFQLVFDILSLHFPHVFIWFAKTSRKKIYPTLVKTSGTQRATLTILYPIVCTFLSIQVLRNFFFLVICLFSKKNVIV